METILAILMVSPSSFHYKVHVNLRKRIPIAFRQLFLLTHLQYERVSLLSSPHLEFSPPRRPTSYALTSLTEHSLHMLSPSKYSCLFSITLMYLQSIRIFIYLLTCPQLGGNGNPAEKVTLKSQPLTPGCLITLDNSLNSSISPFHSFRMKIILYNT